jgi:hypothetical protein
MFGFGLQERVERLAGRADILFQENIKLRTRMHLLEKRLGLTYSEGTKKKAHYKVAGKVGRPRKIKEHGEV